MMKVINIIGFEGLYAITDDGRIFSLKNGKEIKTNLNSKGYLFANLCKNGIKTPVYVHKAVYYSFHNYGFLIRKDNLVIDHIDGNRTNNCLENLRRITSRENTARAKSNKTGYRGVSYREKLNKYSTEISFNKEKYYLGLSETAEEAYDKYLDALKAYKEYGILPNKIDHSIKTCPQCNKTLPVDNFYYTKGHGRGYYCKECMKAYGKQYRETKKLKFNNLS